MNEPTKTDAEVFYDKTAEPMKYFKGPHEEIRSAALEAMATAAEAQSTADGWVDVFARHDIHDAPSVAEAIAEVSRTQVTQEKAAQWKAQAEDGLRREHGERAGEMLRDAVRFIKADPTLASYLAKSGAGNHPSVVRAIVATAAAARRAGKLK